MEKTKNQKKFYPLSGRDFPRFSAVKTFFRLPLAELNEDFDIAIFGVPFDGGTSYRPGARFGPSHLRELSSLGRAYHWGRGINVFERKRVADVGDCPTVPINLEMSYEKIEDFVSKVLSNEKKFISVGGDHSTTLPVLRALRKKVGQALGLVHFDAHLDTYPAAWNCEFHHGSFARHAVEEGLVDPRKMLQIGLRGPLAVAEDLEFVQKHGIQTLTVKDIREQGMVCVKRALGPFIGHPTYLSYDVDCLDPAFAPGTGTPVPGGLSTYEVQQIMQNLVGLSFVGGDVVEVCPAYDVSGITGLAGVDALFEILALL